MIFSELPMSDPTTMTGYSKIINAIHSVRLAEQMSYRLKVQVSEAKLHRQVIRSAILDLIGSLPINILQELRPPLHSDEIEPCQPHLVEVGT